jgi:hypothetical protein
MSPFSQVDALVSKFQGEVMRVQVAVLDAGGKFDGWTSEGSVVTWKAHVGRKRFASTSVSALLEQIAQASGQKKDWGTA